MKNTPYTPLTATPFKRNEAYTELLPGPELAKYIRCYWGSENPYIQKEEHTVPSIIIPDTCVDIIYNIDHTDNTVDAGFCGINDSGFWSSDRRKCGHLVSTFAIRLYAWSVYVFLEDSLKDTINGYYDVQSRFMWLDQILRQQLLEKKSLTERMDAAQEAFLKRLFRIGKDYSNASVRRNSVIEHAMSQIILSKGALSTTELAKECFVSGRQLERLFHEYVGITPKKLCNLVRYQFLWSEMLNDPRFHVADAVYRYGYTDQAHLMREFKRYHTMNINQAKKCAYDNIGNIQRV